jgi:hypothetical protein
MALTITNIVFDCHDPTRVASFWAEALGYATNTEDPDHMTRAATSPIYCSIECLSQKL